MGKFINCLTETGDSLLKKRASVIAEETKEAFEDENILGLYYIYNQAGVKAAKGECEVCQ